MRKNQIILDEAARSVRRAFVGSLAGSATMLGVIGVAGAYGMPERLNTQSLATALTSLQIKLTPVVENAGPIVDRAKTMAASVAPKPRSIEIESDDEVILQVRRFALASASPGQIVPPSRIPAIAAPITPPAEPTAADVIAMPQAPFAPSAEALAAAPAVAGSSAAAPAKPELLKSKLVMTEPEMTTSALPQPAAAVPSQPARAMPGAIADGAGEPPALPAPLVFEPPQLEKIQPLTPLPKIEIVKPPQAAEAPRPVAPKGVERPDTVAASAVVGSPNTADAPVEGPMAATASANAVDIDLPSLDEYPKIVFVHLPVPKPPMSPAQLLNLTGADYDKAEKCLAQAIYFEARAEPVRGQQAVAQVVLNRVFSPHYPKDVCSVVYQNAHRHLACQFTFACDGIRDVVKEPDMWDRAKKIARETLDGQLWLPEVGKSTHYHATYVRPRWIREMRKMVKVGVHIFYRPHRWGDGADEAGWVKPAQSMQTMHAAVKVKGGA